MKRHAISLCSFAVRCAVILALSLSTVRPARSQADSTPKDDRGASLLPDGPGKQLILAKCTVCHTAKMIVSIRGTQEDWNETMDKMIANGATISDEEADKIVAYLTAHFGPATQTAPADAPQAGSASAPASSSNGR